MTVLAGGAKHSNGSKSWIVGIGSNGSEEMATVGSDLIWFGRLVDNDIVCSHCNTQFFEYITRQPNETILCEEPLTNRATRLRHRICNVFSRLNTRFCNGKMVLMRGFCAKFWTRAQASMFAGFRKTSTFDGNFISSCHSARSHYTNNSDEFSLKEISSWLIFGKSQLTFQLIQFAQSFARWCFDENIFALYTHFNGTFVDEFFEFHAVFLVDEDELFAHFTEIDYGIQFLCVFLYVCWTKNDYC